MLYKMTVIVLRLRIKDRHARWLSERAREANLVWNYCNELSHKVWQRERRFLSGFDFWPYLKGATKAGLSLPVQTVQEIAEQYAVRRRAARKTRLSWRKSGGARRSLGWLALSVAQRAREQHRVKAIHAKIAHRRKDHLHKFSNRLVREHRAIFVGNVNAQALVRTRMAKSVLDAGWSSLRTMLRYKCAHAGVWFEEVDEAFSSQTCSSCGGLPPERPKGIAGLGIREWTCSGCATTHDRDVNAARNILAVGHGRLGAGISRL